jgi:hypothetical protein
VTKPKASGSSILERKFLPGQFRDQDFVFYDSSGDTGKVIYQEALHLAYKWHRFGETGKLPQDELDLDKLSDSNPVRYFAAFQSHERPSKAPDSESEEKRGTALDVLLSQSVPSKTPVHPASLLFTQYLLKTSKFGLFLAVPKTVLMTGKKT